MLCPYFAWPLACYDCYPTFLHCCLCCLRLLFVQVLMKGGQKAPWKYLDSIDVEELSFGLVPPALQVASAKFDPTASMLTISMDVRFTSSSAQAVVSTCHTPLPGRSNPLYLL